MMSMRVAMTWSSIVAMFCCAASANLRAADEYEKIANVEYVTRGEEKLLADVYVPTGEGPFPGVLMVHGGAWRTGSKSHMVGHVRELAENGYTVVNIGYRLAPKHKFPAQIDDCKEAVRWMRRNAQRYKIDPRRLAGYGYSAGAHLVCLLGMTDVADGLDGEVEKDSPSTRLQAVVAGGTPCDFEWLRGDGQTLAYWLGGSRNEKPETYHLASPINFVTKDDPPVFFFHGTNDSLVPPGGVDRMMKKMSEFGVNAELYALQEKGHITAFLDATVPSKALDFLNKTLKPNPASEP